MGSLRITFRNLEFYWAVVGKAVTYQINWFTIVYSFIIGPVWALVDKAVLRFLLQIFLAVDLSVHVAVWLS